MAKMVGLSRPIKLEWLNKTVDLLLEGMDESQIKDELNEYLSFEIKSPTNLRKTREILMAIWVITPEKLISLKQCAYEAYKNKTEDRLAAHWSMLLVTYPVFADICSLIGKLTKIQDTFTTAWIKDRLYEVWGERTTLLYSIDKILQTLKFIGAIETVKPGVYQIQKHEIASKNSIEVLLRAMLLLKEKAYYEVSELSCVPKLFPFVFEVSHEWLHNSEEFKLNNFGGKVVLTAE